MDTRKNLLKKEERNNIDNILKEGKQGNKQLNLSESKNQSKKLMKNNEYYKPLINFNPSLGANELGFKGGAAQYQEEFDNM